MALPSMIETQSDSLRPTRGWLSFVRYAGVRVVMLFLTAVAGVYVTIIVANLGGHVDDIVRSAIIEGIGMGLGRDPEVMKMPLPEREALINRAVAAAEEAAGLNEPFVIRSWRWLSRGLTLDLGESRRLKSLYAVGQDRFTVRRLILERLPITLLIIGLANLLSFVASLWVAPRVARKYGSLADKLVVALSPISSAPSWFHGLFLVALFAGELHLLPFTGLRPAPPPDSPILYALGVIRHTILPVLAIFASVFFQGLYTWRTLFLIHASEDYVEMATAKGLPPGQIERRHIMRPTLPAILTNVALVMLSAWSGAIMLEALFALPGLGQLFYQALIYFDTAVVVGLTVVYAYLLVATTLILDIAYALVDPRVRLWHPRAPRARPLRHRRNRARAGEPAHRHQPIAAKRPRIPPPSAKAPSPSAAAGIGLARGFGIAKRTLRQIARYPSALIGLAIILLMLGSIAYTLIAIPYHQAIAYWRGDLDLSANPRNARPVWFDWFTPRKLPRSLRLSSLEGDGAKHTTPGDRTSEILLTFDIPYPYDGFPQQLVITFATQYDQTPPHAAMTWRTPDGRDIRLGQAIAENDQVYRLAQDTRLLRRLGGIPPEQALFTAPDAATPTPLQGTYQLTIRGTCFEDACDLDAAFIMHGQIYGIAGTDTQRRDLSVALLWGVPTAMGFGLAAAIITTLATMTLAAISAWYGGAVDAIIQRLTEINLILPVFPILAMVTLLYTTRILHILLIAVALGILGAGIKTYRAMFLQIKQSPYIEAARAYGASDARIITRYLVPRIVPLLVPQMITLVPSYVFLEASLAFLGLSDPILPTWGKVIHDAHVANALLNGHPYWILQPAALLLLTSLAYAMVGYALDRALNPRLRQT